MTAERDDDYHLSEDLVDQAAAWLRLQRATDRDSPFFLYLAFGATHAPLHVALDGRDKYHGRFAHGWDEQRLITLARRKALGLVPEQAILPPWPDDVPHWEELSELERTVAQSFMRPTPDSPSTPTPRSDASSTS